MNSNFRIFKRPEPIVDRWAQTAQAPIAAQPLTQPARTEAVAKSFTIDREVACQFKRQGNTSPEESLKALLKAQGFQGDCQVRVTQGKKTATGIFNVDRNAGHSLECGTLIIVEANTGISEDFWIDSSDVNASSIRIEKLSIEETLSAAEPIPVK